MRQKHTNSNANQPIYSSKNEPTNHRQGIAALEFLFAAPAFFVLVFFVIEIALIWNDRHIMKLAAYRSAKTVVKARFDADPTANLCWRVQSSGAPVGGFDDALHARARRSASKVMAVITPPLPQLLAALGVTSPLATMSPGETIIKSISDNIVVQYGRPDTFTSSTSTPSASAPPLVTSTGIQKTGDAMTHAIIRMLSGLPSAWIYTSLQCSDVVFPATANSIESKGVEMTLTYNRPAKMPYMGTLMWSLHKLQKIAQVFGQEDDGTSGVFKINALDFGLEYDSKKSAAAISAAQAKIKQEIVRVATDLGHKIDEEINNHDFAIPGSTSGSSSPLSSIFGTLAEKGFDEVQNAARPIFNQRLVDWIGHAAVEIVIMAPDLVKTIPIQATVRVPRYSDSYVNAGQSWDGQAVLLGKFHGDSNVAKLAKKMSEVMDIGTPPNSGRGLPYTNGSP
ncbi:MAG: pilus assembly protein [Proteobacteria bacterium]|nr:pilus assembly protein [Pseudomonadota bacterium]